MLGGWFIVECVEGIDRVSDTDKAVSDEISIDSFTKFVSPCVNDCVIQCGTRCVDVEGFNGFYELVRMWWFILNNQIGYLDCFVVKLFVIAEEYFQL